MDIKAGYIPGKGRTFTPSLTASWIEEFNELLNKSGVSRNSLTEELIELGLRSKRNEHLLISTNSLTPEQIELLSSEQGQTILLNVALMLMGQQNAILPSATFQASSLEIASAVTEPITSQPEINVSLQPEQLVENTEQDLVSSLPDRLISQPKEDKNEEKTPLSPAQKAAMRYKSLMKDKGELRK